MHKIRISAEAPPQTPLGSLQRSPDPLAGFKAGFILGTSGGGKFPLQKFQIPPQKISRA